MTKVAFETTEDFRTDLKIVLTEAAAAGVAPKFYAVKSGSIERVSNTELAETIAELFAWHERYLARKRKAAA